MTDKKIILDALEKFLDDLDAACEACDSPSASLKYHEAKIRDGTVGLLQRIDEGKTTHFDAILVATIIRGSGLIFANKFATEWLDQQKETEKNDASHKVR